MPALIPLALVIADTVHDLGDADDAALRKQGRRSNAIVALDLGGGYVIAAL
jgi:hypothetical protein